MPCWIVSRTVGFCVGGSSGAQVRTHVAKALYKAVQVLSRPVERREFRAGIALPFILEKDATQRWNARKLSYLSTLAGFF